MQLRGEQSGDDERSGAPLGQTKMAWYARYPREKRKRTSVAKVMAAKRARMNRITFIYTLNRSETDWIRNIMAGHSVEMTTRRLNFHKLISLSSPHFLRTRLPTTDRPACWPWAFWFFVFCAGYSPLFRLRCQTISRTLLKRFGPLLGSPQRYVLFHISLHLEHQDTPIHTWPASLFWQRPCRLF